MKPNTVVISGANGLVGTRLTHHLQQHAYTVLPLIRPHSQWEGDSLRWDPSKQEMDSQSLEGISAVIHLSGEPIASGRWTDTKKRRIRDSRVNTTRFLAETLSGLTNPPETLICASAVGYYGDRGDEVLDENSPPGSGFLPEVCVAWENAAEPARQAGIRVVQLRFGIILTFEGGALRQMLPAFRLGAAGMLGGGTQYMPWISIADTISIIQFMLERSQNSGAFNVTAPEPVTNRAFTKTLGSVLRRPTLFPVPAFALRLLLGEMADALLLSSTRAVPKRLCEHEYSFQHTELKQTLTHLIQNQV